MQLTDKDRKDSHRVATRLMRGLNSTGEGLHHSLIQSYLQEAIIYARTGHWELEEAAAKIEGRSSEEL